MLCANVLVLVLNGDGDSKIDTGQSTHQLSRIYVGVMLYHIMVIQFQNNPAVARHALKFDFVFIYSCSLQDFYKVFENQVDSNGSMFLLPYVLASPVVGK